MHQRHRRYLLMMECTSWPNRLHPHLQDRLQLSLPQALLEEVGLSHRHRPFPQIWTNQALGSRPLQLERRQFRRGSNH